MRLFTSLQKHLVLEHDMAPTCDRNPTQEVAAWGVLSGKARPGSVQRKPAKGSVRSLPEGVRGPGRRGNVLNVRDLSTIGSGKS